MLLKKLIKFSLKKYNKLNIKGLATNSKEVKKGFIFFAIKGRQFNGEKYMAQEQIHLDDIKLLEKEKNEESKTVHKYMQDILNERIDSANKIIQELTNDTNKAIKVSKKIKIPKKQKKTKKKKKKNGKKSK